MRLVLLEYLRMLRESGEFDALLPELLLAMNIVPISKAQIGVRQSGVDLSAVGNDENGIRTFWLFVLKRGDLGRRDWDSTPQSVRQSFDEIKDVYLRSHVAPEHTNLPVKIIVATTGDFKQDFEQQRVGYAAANTGARCAYEFWNGDRVAALMEQHLLDEYAMPSNARSHFRRALALISETDYELNHFYTLLDILLNWNPDEKLGNFNHHCVRALHTTSLALGILCRWAAHEDNLKSAVVACERTLLWAWDAIRRNGLAESSEIIQAYGKCVEIYLNTTVEYFNKVEAHLNTADALAKYPTESALLTERVFEEIGLIATIGLSHFMWNVADADATRELRMVPRTLANFLITHRISSSPCYDGQCIDIALALTLLCAAKEVEAAKTWLRELSSCLVFGFRSERWFPISTDSFDDLVELEVSKETVDLKRLKETSWMLPTLLQWMAVLKLEDAYNHLVRLTDDTLKDTHLQLWYPDEKTEAYLYRGPAQYDSGITEAPIKLPLAVQEMCAMMKKTRMESPVKNAITTSAAETGFGWLDFIANRHFRTPPDPAIWQELSDCHANGAAAKPDLTI